MFDEGFLTIMNSPSSKVVRKRSVFKSAITYVENREQAEEFYISIKSHNKGARHNVWAYLIFETNLAYCSDDGEPCKTAGEPVLNVLKSSGLFNVCVVVTRYFGGVLLGTGGLVEAYSSACKSILEEVDYARCCLCAKVRLVLDYSAYSKLQFLLSFFEVEILAVNYAVEVAVEFFIEYSKFDQFKGAVRQKIGPVYFCEILKKSWTRLKISRSEVEKFKHKGK